MKKLFKYGVNTGKWDESRINAFKREDHTTNIELINNNELYYNYINT